MTQKDKSEMGEMTVKEDHVCLHERDFGILFTKVDLMCDAFRSQTEAMGLLRTSISGLLKFQNSTEAVIKNRKERKSMSMQHAIFYSSIILGVFGLLITLIIAFV